jgi:hypothetical protein
MRWSRALPVIHRDADARLENLARALRIRRPLSGTRLNRRVPRQRYHGPVVLTDPTRSPSIAVTTPRALPDSTGCWRANSWIRWVSDPSATARRCRPSKAPWQHHDGAEIQRPFATPAEPYRATAHAVGAIHPLRDGERGQEGQQQECAVEPAIAVPMMATAMQARTWRTRLARQPRRLPPSRPGL